MKRTPSFRHPSRSHFSYLNHHRGQREVLRARWNIAGNDVNCPFPALRFRHIDDFDIVCRVEFEIGTGGRLLIPDITFAGWISHDEVQVVHEILAWKIRV